MVGHERNDEVLSERERKRLADTQGFFFQAEDGIRDVAVTGVQTCALPIYYNDCIQAVRDVDIVIHLASKVGGIGFYQRYPFEEIGRASCRERV